MTTAELYTHFKAYSQNVSHIASQSTNLRAVTESMLSGIRRLARLALEESGRHPAFDIASESCPNKLLAITFSCVRYLKARGA